MSSLERITIPLPPSYAELEAAILAFHAEFYDMHWSDYSGTPADLVLLSLAERISAARGQDAPGCAVASILGEERT